MEAVTSAASGIGAQAQVGREYKAQQTAASFWSSLKEARKSVTESMDDIFEEASATYGVSVDLIKAVAKAESNFNPDAVSRAGAQGVMQLMPGTARALGVTDSFDARQNIMGGTKYLKQNLERFHGDVSLALAAYNAGPGSVEKYGGVPPYAETQNYVKKVCSYMEGAPLYAGRTVSLGSRDAARAIFALGNAYGNDSSVSAGEAASSMGGLYNTSMLSALGALYGSMGSGGFPSLSGSSGYDSLMNLFSSSGYDSLAGLYGSSGYGSLAGLFASSLMGSLGSGYDPAALYASGSPYRSALSGNGGDGYGLASYGTAALAGLGSDGASSALTGTGSLFGLSSLYGSSADMLGLLFGAMAQETDGNEEAASTDAARFSDLLELTRLQMLTNADGEAGSV